MLCIAISYKWTDSNKIYLLYGIYIIFIYLLIYILCTKMELVIPPYNIGIRYESVFGTFAKKMNSFMFTFSP